MICAPLREQANTLVEWCQGFLVGLGLSSVETSDEEVLEMIKDISEISQLEVDLLDNEENSQDFYEIVEFVRMGVLFIQETLQPSKQDFISVLTSSTKSKNLAVIYKKIGQRKLYIFVYNKTTLLNKMVESMNEIFLSI